MERLKYNNQPNHAQINSNTNQNNHQNSQANTWQIQQQPSTATPSHASIGLNLNNIINVRIDRNVSTNTIVESNNYYPRDEGGANSEIYDDAQTTEYNIANEAVQLQTELNSIQVNQQLFNFESSLIQNNQVQNNPRGGTKDNTINNSNQKRRSQNGLSQGEKRFVCEHCNKEFKLKHHLTRYFSKYYKN